MYKIVNDILNVETLESGNIKLNIQRRNLADTLKNVLNSNLISAQNKKISIYLSSPSEFYANVDVDRMQEAFDNYVSNAIKYSPIGKSIYLSLYLTQENSKNQLIFKIRDEGPGLTDKDKEKVFGRFQKLTARPTANEPSSGLGLSIVQTIAGFHKGKVWVESVVKEGASFYLQIEADIENYEAIAYYLNCEKFENYEKAEEYIEINNAVKLIEDFNFEKLSEIERNNIKSITCQVQNELLSNFEAIYKKNILSEIRQFARNVETLGLNSHVEILSKYASYLTKYAAFFELENVEKALEAFPLLVKKIIRS